MTVVRGVRQIRVPGNAFKKPFQKPFQKVLFGLSQLPESAARNNNESKIQKRERER